MVAMRGGGGYYVKFVPQSAQQTGFLSGIEEMTEFLVLVLTHKALKTKDGNSLVGCHHVLTPCQLTFRNDLKEAL